MSDDSSDIDLIASDLISFKETDKPLSIEDQESVRIKISDVENVLKLQPQLEIKTTHHFSQGVYAREIEMPKGAILIGKIHKHQNLVILSKGEISMMSIEGAKRIKAPFTMVSCPGIKRIAYVHEDAVFTTIHGTNETDLEKIEEEFIAKDYYETLSLEEIKLLQGELK